MIACRCDVRLPARLQTSELDQIVDSLLAAAEMVMKEGEMKASA